jgi:hypothetical protein
VRITMFEIFLYASKYLHIIHNVNNPQGEIMVDILHKVGIKSSSTGKVYKALTTLDCWE